MKKKLEDLVLSFVVLTYNQIPDTDTRAKNNANPEH